jgi:hypothetical protein
MAFTANNLSGDNPTPKIPPTSNQLNAVEIEVLLSLIKRSTFLGEQIEPIYNMVIKLQNQYLEQTKK